MAPQLTQLSPPLRTGSGASGLVYRSSSEVAAQLAALRDMPQELPRTPKSPVRVRWDPIYFAGLPRASPRNSPAEHRHESRPGLRTRCFQPPAACIPRCHNRALSLPWLIVGSPRVPAAHSSALSRLCRPFGPVARHTAATRRRRRSMLSRLLAAALLVVALSGTTSYRMHLAEHAGEDWDSEPDGGWDSEGGGAATRLGPLSGLRSWLAGARSAGRRSLREGPPGLSSLSLATPRAVQRAAGSADPGATAAGAHQFERWWFIGGCLLGAPANGKSARGPPNKACSACRRLCTALPITAQPWRTCTYPFFAQGCLRGCLRDACARCTVLQMATPSLSSSSSSSRGPWATAAAARGGRAPRTALCSACWRSGACSPLPSSSTTSKRRIGSSTT